LPPNARVVFRPKSGRPSAGTTDAEGRYEVLYTVDEPGALPGPHTISISTFVEPNSDSDDPVQQKGQPEGVPAVYNRKSTLTHDIDPEHSEPVDFDLQSKPDGRTAAK